MRETMHYLQTALAGLSALGLAAGCASVDPKSPSTSAAGAGDVASKPFVFLAIQPDSHARLKNAAAKVTKESKLVRGSTFEQSEADQADYTFRLGFEVREGSLTAPEVIWGMTTIMLLTVYPATCNQHHYTLTADLEDRAGNRIKSYALYRSQRQFLWLFRGPNCEVPTERRVQRVAQSMLAEVYGDVAKSGVLKRPGAAVAGAPAGPLVYLSVSRAQDIVERATKATSPFARFTFDPAQASLADLSVHMDFSAHGGEPESFASLMGRGMSAMMTLGVVSMCPATDMRLTARVLSANQSVVKSYALSDKVRADIEPDGACPRHDESTHPQVVDALVRKLYRQMAKDGIGNIGTRSGNADVRATRL